MAERLVERTGGAAPAVVPASREGQGGDREQDCGDSSHEPPQASETGWLGSAGGGADQFQALLVFVPFDRAG
jgi:hypothetical protein